MINGLVMLTLYSIFAAGSRKGVIQSINFNTSTHKVAVFDPLFIPEKFESLGVNGVEIRGLYLYFTSTSSKSVSARV